MEYYFALLALTLMAALGNSTADEFSDCLEHEICVEPDGIQNGLDCVAKLGKADAEFAKEFFRDAFGDSSMEFPDIFQLGCAIPEEGRQITNDYLDARNEHESESNIDEGDNAKLTECRNCMMTLVKACQFKKSMGMI